MPYPPARPERAAIPRLHRDTESCPLTRCREQRQEHGRQVQLTLRELASDVMANVYVARAPASNVPVDDRELRAVRAVLATTPGARAFDAFSVGVCVVTRIPNRNRKSPHASERTTESQPIATTQLCARCGKSAWFEPEAEYIRFGMGGKPTRNACRPGTGAPIDGSGTLR